MLRAVQRRPRYAGRQTTGWTDMTANLGPDEVSKIVEEELTRFSIAGTRAAFLAVMCNPHRQDRTWDWNQGQTVEVWVVARFEASDVLLVYSRDGYGDPWGWVSASDRQLGMDAQWHAYLEDAVIASGAWKGTLPLGYEVR
jgi:hypothetical protein